MSSVHATFLVSAPDQPGLVARLSGFFYELALNIVDASNHTDVHSEAPAASAGVRDALATARSALTAPHEPGPARFFMRLVVDLAGLSRPGVADKLGGSADRQTLERAFDGLSRSLEATWSVGYSDVLPRVALLVTKDPTCLYDLVLRQRSGELACEIPLVISNHSHLESVAQSFRIPFVALPVTAETKASQERQILEHLARHHVDLVVLARYMQILSAPLCAALKGRAINIHHSFLPSFKGARPYVQAHDRGVKLIGATAHYVTADLDEGPIIEQDVARVDHSLDTDDLTAVGRDVECVVLARAVRWHVEHRVLMNGHKTVVFR